MISKTNHKRDGNILDFEIKYGTQRKAKLAFLQICVTEKEKKSVEGQTLFFSLEIASYCSESFGYIKLLRILDFAMKLVYYHVAQEMDGESFIAINNGAHYNHGSSF